MDIRELAARHLANRMRTRSEMRKHLKEKGCGEEETEELIRDFSEKGYLDDLEYSRQYLAYAFEKGRGFWRAKQELLRKGVSSDVIEMAFEEYDGPSEGERAQIQADKLAASMEINEKLLGKIGRRLSSMGYPESIIYPIINGYRENRRD